MAFGAYGGWPIKEKKEGNESQAKDKAYYLFNANSRQGKTRH